MRSPEQDNYQTAFNLVRQRLKQADISERCRKSGAVYQLQEGIITIKFISRLYLIQWPGLDFAPSAPTEEVPLRDKILILHYLNKASGIPPSGKLITFVQLPGCEPYLPVFQKRTIDRLVRTFGRQPENLIAAAQTIGGSKAQYGDVGVVIPALPKVSVTFILWRGDDEFSPSGNILFDRTVENYLDVEDIIVLSEIIVGELCRHAMKTSRTEEGI